MTARQLAISALADWPRWLSAKDVAAYAEVSLNFPLVEVKRGICPKHFGWKFRFFGTLDAASRSKVNVDIRPGDGLSATRPSILGNRPKVGNQSSAQGGGS